MKKGKMLKMLKIELWTFPIYFLILYNNMIYEDEINVM